MVTPALIHYIQDSLAQGKQKEQIQKELLLAGGWQVSDIDEAFAVISGTVVQKKKGPTGIAWGPVTIVILIVVGVILFVLYRTTITTAVTTFLTRIHFVENIQRIKAFIK